MLSISLPTPPPPPPPTHTHTEIRASDLDEMDKNTIHILFDSLLRIKRVYIFHQSQIFIYSLIIDLKKWVKRQHIQPRLKNGVCLGLRLCSKHFWKYISYFRLMPTKVFLETTRTFDIGIDPQYE